MRAEERAEQLVQAIACSDACFDKRGWIEMPKADRQRYLDRSSEHIGRITQAIRDAEDAAYERAIEEADGCRIPPNSGEWGGGFIDGKNAAANAIRSLKSNPEKEG